jgi:hypothetical protein
MTSLVASMLARFRCPLRAFNLKKINNENCQPHHTPSGPGWFGWPQPGTLDLSIFGNYIFAGKEGRKGIEDMEELRDASESMKVAILDYSPKRPLLAKVYTYLSRVVPNESLPAPALSHN